MAEPSPPPAIRLDQASGRWIVAAAVLGSGMAMLDATVVNVALPALGKDLGAGLDGLQWTLNGYTLTLASFILLGGSLGDRFGRRRVFVIGTSWFALASLLCALAPNVELLVAARALQGVGGALLTPGSLAMIAASFQGDERGRAIGIWSGLGGIAGALGPFLGGWLVGSVGWRWVFLINLPIAAAVVFVAQRHVKESRDLGASRRIDVAGATLGALGLAATTYALVDAGERGASTTTAICTTVGVMAMAGFVVVERRIREPMLPLQLFSSRQFGAANAVTFLVYAALGGVFFLLVLHLQIVAGFSPLVAGTALLPITAIMLLLSGPAGALAERIGPRLPMAAGPALSSVGLLLMLRIGPHASYLLDVLPAVVVFGLGLSLTVAPLTTTVLAAADARFAGIASGVNNAVARAASLLAVAVLPLVAGLRGRDYQAPQSFAAGFSISVVVCAGLLAMGGLLAALSIRNDRPATVHAPEAAARTKMVPRHCGVGAPPLQVGDPHRPARG